MDKLDIIIWILGTGFTFVFGLMCLMWSGLNKRFDRVDQRIDKLDEKLTDVDRRVCRMEGAFSNQECCVIKSDSQLKKAE